MKKYSYIVFILVLGIACRLYNVQWDQNFHLHPDERFLTLIGIKESIPPSFMAYIHPEASSLNPFILGFPFFVYGVFPLTLTVLTTHLLHAQTYDLFTLTGRILSALFDSFTILVVYKIAEELEKQHYIAKQVKYYAAFFYAISVLPIQLSHFFTVDTFLTFFMILSFYFSLLFLRKINFLVAVLSAASIGIAVACKINALAIVPLIFFILSLPFLAKKISLQKMLSVVLVYAVIAYVAVRVTDPYLFATGSFLDFHINEHFLQSIQQLLHYGDPKVWYPPTVQWATKLPIVFSLYNIILFGLGIGLSILCIVGMIVLMYKKRIVGTALLVWTLCFFLYQSLQHVQIMRYFIFLYPFFALFAGVGFVRIIQTKNRFIPIAIFLFTIVWPISFMSIYTKLHTRVAASEWIYSNLPDHSVILGEYWDDPLPLPVDNGKTFSVDLLHVFDNESAQKWSAINQQLSHANYLVLSSNRAWGSITSDAQQYPQTSAWYNNLFAGKTPYKKIAEFTSYPSLTYLGIPITIPDFFAEEAFTVNDHPVVMIFKNSNLK